MMYFMQLHKIDSISRIHLYDWHETERCLKNLSFPCKKKTQKIIFLFSPSFYAQLNCVWDKNLFRGLWARISKFIQELGFLLFPKK